VPTERTPAWKRAFDLAEKAIAPRLEAAVRTEQFAETASALTKLQKNSKKQISAAGQQTMHAWNIPTAIDVAKLSAQIVELERRVRDLSKQLDAVLEATSSLTISAPAKPAATRRKRA
jgi:polyhydroxyalkanoate synthesis regulator phasin